MMLWQTLALREDSSSPSGVADLSLPGALEMESHLKPKIWLRAFFRNLYASTLITETALKRSFSGLRTHVVTSVEFPFACFMHLCVADFSSSHASQEGARYWAKSQQKRQA